MKRASSQNLGSKKYFDFGLKTVVLPLFSTRDFIGDMGFAWSNMNLDIPGFEAINSDIQSLTIYYGTM